jgi:hypothetical protein
MFRQKISEDVYRISHVHKKKKKKYLDGIVGISEKLKK